MTSNRRLSGAVALGLSVALTGAFAAPSFAAPADDAELKNSVYATATVDGTVYDKVTQSYTDGTVIVTLFTDNGDEDDVLDEEDDILYVTETSPGGTVTRTEEDYNESDYLVTVTESVYSGAINEDDLDQNLIRFTETTYDGTEDENVVSVEITEYNAKRETTRTDVTDYSGDDFENSEQTVTVIADNGEKTVTKTVIAIEDDVTVETEVTRKPDGSKIETTTVTEKELKTVTKTVTQPNGESVKTEVITETGNGIVTKTELFYNAENTLWSAKKTETETLDDEVTKTVTEVKLEEKGTKLVTEVETADDGTVTTTVTRYEANDYSIQNVAPVGEATGKEISKTITPGKGDPKPTEPTEPTFSDNKPGSAFYASVQWMAENDISVGYADGTYKKNKDVTRGETTQFLYKYEDPEFTAPSKSPFSDVNVGGAFFTPITWAASEKITGGFADGTFKPSQAVTRAQFAAFLYGLEDPQFAAPTTSPFGDVNAGGGYYDAITWLASEGITVGDTKGDFNPSDEITRGQISAFMKLYNDSVEADAVAAE